MASMGGVLRVTVSHMPWTLPDEVLLQVFGPYGGNKVYVLERTSSMVAYIFFLPDHDASKAQRALHGRCIYDNCCWMDVQMVLRPSTCSSGVEATKTAPAAATPSIQPSCTSSPSATSAPTTTTATTAAAPPTPAAPSGRVPTSAPTSTPSSTSTPTSPTRTFLRFPTPPFLAATKKIIKASRLRHARTAVSVVTGATQAAGSACVTGRVSAVRAPQPVLPRQDPRRKGRSDGCRLSLRRLRRPWRHACGVPTGRLRQARPKRARLRRPRRGARVPRPRVRTRLCEHCRGDGPLRPRRDGRRALGHHRRPPPLRLPRRVRRRAPRPLRRIFHRGRLRLRVQGLGRKHQPRRRALRHGHHRSRRRRHHLPRLRAQHHHHAFRGGLPQGTPGRHPRHRRWELCVRGAGVQSCAGFSRGRRDARGCSSPTPASSTTARSSSTATPTAARTPPTPMPLQYKSWTLVASAWSKPAAVSREALEVFDGMSCRYITTLQPSQLIEVLLLGCATDFHEARKQFEEMVEPLDHFVWSVPTSEMSRPFIYSMTQYMMRFLCWEIGNGVVGSWFQQAQLTVGFLLEASPWLVLKLSLAVSKLTHIQSQSWSSWLPPCPRSICISCIFSLVGGQASFFSQLATCWSWKPIIFSCNYSVMVVASFMVVHLHWPKEDQLRPTPWPSFNKEHLRRLLSVAQVPFPIEVSLHQSNLDSVHWHTGSSPLYILELRPWPSPAAFRSINTSWSMLSFGAFWCVQLLGNNVNLQAHGKGNLMVNTNTCWMDWGEHVNAMIAVTISGVQLFFQFEETARKNKEVCLQIPMILGLVTWCQFSEVDCNINWVSQRRVGLRVDRSKHSTSGISRVEYFRSICCAEKQAPWLEFIFSLHDRQTIIRGLQILYSLAVPCSGLRASRISSGGECQELGWSMGYPDWAIGWASSYLVKTAALRIYGPTGIWKGHGTEIRI